MQSLNEFFEYLSDFHPVSKRIMKTSALITFVLLLCAMYFALSAGRTNEYYENMYWFLIFIENAKSIFGIGCFFALLFEPISKMYNLE